ncbi:uncharacterized protein BT62DRAFT_95124 [Guyanagaster necrorhizus]|uniref:Uncharacterized protein n=1 Tax=Guyanagaster necrorhizus TaxID=856835 RepID=A0A9P7VUI1_9AGAR|nr:uncharacterized protein BT62DRAFT_95124 [Guyanagaster necrorhizus MCA 3950]KAG7446965.1 hypothetical protein BT62DRAFT_95124 [Guyanagaster necrorhizus MCA 3950]
METGPDLSLATIRIHQTFSVRYSCMDTMQFCAPQPYSSLEISCSDATELISLYGTACGSRNQQTMSEEPSREEHDTQPQLRHRIFPSLSQQWKRASLPDTKE